MEQVTLRVPATTANLGPGFDSLGCALALYDTMTFTKRPNGLVITGSPTEYCNAEHLAVRAYRAAMSRIDPYSEEGLALDIRSEIPISRGLGSSAAMIAGGVMAANLLHGFPLSREELLAIANEIEGHPDNLAPALWGGLTASLVEDGIPFTIRMPLSEKLRFVAAVPDYELSTQKARAVLPSNVSYADAVYNVSHAAVLLGALRDGNPDVIRTALRDRLHQPYRRALIDDFDLIEKTAHHCGCIAFCISGAGPTLLSLTDDAAFADRMRKRLGSTRHQWRILDLPVDREGARIAE